jgi:hypothetical protein
MGEIMIADEPHK